MAEEIVPPEMIEANRLVKEFVAKISEHVDSVTVFVNKRREDGHRGTWRMVDGAGNWYARYGHIIDYVECEKSHHYDFSESGEDGSG